MVRLCARAVEEGGTNKVVGRHRRKYVLMAERRCVKFSRDVVVKHYQTLRSRGLERPLLEMTDCPALDRLVTKPARVPAIRVRVTESGWSLKVLAVLVRVCHLEIKEPHLPLIHLRRWANKATHVHIGS